MPKFIQWALNYDWLTGIWGRAWPNQQTWAVSCKVWKHTFLLRWAYLQIKGAAFFWGFFGPPSDLMDNGWSSLDFYSNTSHQTPKHVKRKAAFWTVCWTKIPWICFFFQLLLQKKTFPTSLFQCSSTGCSQSNITEKLQEKPPFSPPSPICGPLRLVRRERSRWHPVPWFLDPVSRGEVVEEISCNIIGEKDGEMLQNSEHSYIHLSSCGVCIFMFLLNLLVTS